jgi:hypothetical protein
MKRALMIATLAATFMVPSTAAAVPDIDFSCVPAPASCQGWYRQPVTVKWSWLPTDATIDAGCNSNDPVNVDTVRAVRFCKVTDPTDMIATQIEVPLKVDMTPPVVTGATPSRPADTNGWYRSPLQVAFSGTDAMSGLLGCTSATYGGPDGVVSVSGTCRDKAGNVSVPGVFSLRYDATPPSVTKIGAVGGDHVARLQWQVSGATAVEVWRSPGRAGTAQSLLDTRAEGLVRDQGLRNGRRYHYTVRAFDDAGNATARVYSIIPGRRLIAPASGARFDDPPLLRWTAVRHASYYNVQLFRGRRKVLSAWPAQPRLELERSWRYGGRRVRLKPGLYRWLVWPGSGPRARNDYGALIGRRSFTMR